MTYRVTIQDVLKIVSKQYAVSVNLLLSSIRTHNVTRPRNIAFYLARKYTRYKYGQYNRIAEAFRKNHATVLYGSRMAERQLTEAEKKRLEQLIRVFEKEHMKLCRQLTEERLAA